ncbi:uncharacterized protein LOC107824921 [Nicotiana tabacum]|uniref:Uncharacterized protein LOC107824921 n=1 Tax=Nicotiana tabacum TaxID=4097 RepID=A0AC58UBD5_TOBAC
MAIGTIFHLVRSHARHLKYRNFQSVYSGRFAALILIYCLAQFSAFRRWLSQSATAQDDNKLSKGPCKGGAAGSEKDGEVVYDGPFSCTINFVKILCLIHFGITVSLSPHLAFAMSPDMNVVLKGAVPSLFILFGAYTTIYYHWTRSPYIHKLRWKPGSDSFDVEMISWRASYIPKTIKFADINERVVTFEANGNLYYVDDKHFHNKALLAKLTPQKPTHE